MDFQKILAGDIARYDQSQVESSYVPNLSEKVKTNIESRRSMLLGEILLARFPELNCFQPQLNKAANDWEFKPFNNFLESISKGKKFQDALKKMVSDKQAEHEIGKEQDNV